MSGMTTRRRQAEKAGRGAFKPCRRERPVLEALGLPEDVTGNSVRLTVMGSRRLLAENYRALVEVTETRVRLMAKGGIVTVSGEKLRLEDVRPHMMCIVGQISAIELPTSREAEP